jgi:hypothetical protein
MKIRFELLLQRLDVSDKGFTLQLNVKAYLAGVMPECDKGMSLNQCQVLPWFG